MFWLTVLVVVLLGAGVFGFYWVALALKRKLRIALPAETSAPAMAPAAKAPDPERGLYRTTPPSAGAG
jgi:hypothetical protein